VFLKAVPQPDSQDTTQHIHLAGHSGWRHVLDVELTCKEGPQAGLWEGTYLVPAGQLPLPTHLEVNWAFKVNWITA
jgi:hypothetical protein